MKKVVCFCLFIVAMLAFAACHNTEEVETLQSESVFATESTSSAETEGGIEIEGIAPPKGTGVFIYQSDNVKVELLESPTEMYYAEYGRSSPTEDSAYGKNTVIIRGTISNIREARVTYWYEQFAFEATDEITLFDVTVSEVLHCRTKHYSDKQTVTVGFAYTAHEYAEGVPLLEEGKEFLLFAYAPEDREDDSMELAGYMDLWCRSAHYLMLEKVGTSYLTTGFFAPASEGKSLAQELNLTESDVKYFAQLREDGERMQAFLDQRKNADGSNADALTALIALRTLTKSNSPQLWAMTQDYYAINANELEAYILSVIEKRND